MIDVKQMKPFGVLYAGEHSYFILQRTPLPKDSWQHDQQQMWFVTPVKQFETDFEARIKLESGDVVISKEGAVYYKPMHVVATNPVIEFKEMYPINILNIVDEDVLIHAEYDKENQLDDMLEEIENDR